MPRRGEQRPPPGGRRAETAQECSIEVGRPAVPARGSDLLDGQRPLFQERERETTTAPVKMRPESVACGPGQVSRQDTRRKAKLSGDVGFAQVDLGRAPPDHVERVNGDRIGSDRIGSVPHVEKPDRPECQGFYRRASLLATRTSRSADETGRRPPGRPGRRAQDLARPDGLGTRGSSARTDRAARGRPAIETTLSDIRAAESRYGLRLPPSSRSAPRLRCVGAWRMRVLVLQVRRVISRGGDADHQTSFPCSWRCYRPRLRLAWAPRGAPLIAEFATWLVAWSLGNLRLE
jgi:hypothetical protein